MRDLNLAVNLKILKLPIPVIWLDTSILFDIVRWKQGKPLSDIHKEKRIPALYTSIYDLVRKERLICPEAAQDEENERYGLSMLRKVLSELSLGVGFVHGNSITEIQRYAHMKAFTAGESEIEISYKRAFLNDPMRALKEAKSSGFILRVDIVSQADIDKITNERRGLRTEFESLRSENQTNKITYKDQLEIEYLSYYRYLLDEINFYLSFLKTPVYLSINDILRMGNLNRIISVFSRLTNKDCDIDGLLLFSKSEYYRSMPIIDISCKLSALVVTGTRKITSGDYMDIRHLSAVTPYCSAVITDRYMCHSLRSLDIGAKYNTLVFSLGDFDQIMEYLNSL